MRKIPILGEVRPRKTPRRVLLTTAPKEALVEQNGVGGNPYDRTDTYLAWTCSLPLEDRLSVTCPATGLRFLKENVPDVEMLEYPTWQEYRDKLASEKWDMVGISFYTWSTPVAIEMAKEAREAGVQEIWGGNYGVLGPPEQLEPHFTRLVKGAGETVLHEYVYGTPLPYIKHPPMLGVSSFRGMAAGVGYLYSKRGCNIGCTFCSTPIFNPHEDALAMQSLYDALDVYREQKVAQVIIYDETFFLENELAEKVIDALAERELPWICLTRADRIRGRISELTDRCMDGAIIGIESMRDANLDDVHKRDDVWNVRETIRELNRHGRRAMGTFMLGFERDDAETIQEDIRQLAGEGLFACQLTLLTPFYGTKLYKDMERRGVITETDLSKFDLYNKTWAHPTISHEEARELLSWAQRMVNQPELMAKKIREDMKTKRRKALMKRETSARAELVSTRRYAAATEDAT